MRRAHEGVYPSKSFKNEIARTVGIFQKVVDAFRRAPRRAVIDTVVSKPRLPDDLRQIPAPAPPPVIHFRHVEPLANILAIAALLYVVVEAIRKIYVESGVIPTDFTLTLAILVGLSIFLFVQAHEKSRLASLSEHLRGRVHQSNETIVLLQNRLKDIEERLESSETALQKANKAASQKTEIARRSLSARFKAINEKFYLLAEAHFQLVAHLAEYQAQERSLYKRILARLSLDEGIEITKELGVYREELHRQRLSTLREMCNIISSMFAPKIEVCTNLKFVLLDAMGTPSDLLKCKYATIAR
jgi:hypothetical protein